MKSKELRGYSIERLNQIKRELEIEKIRVGMILSRAGSFPAAKTPTTKIRDIKRNIARINTIISEKKNNI